jgi:tetratricopeptide (TPR) repeat protein
VTTEPERSFGRYFSRAGRLENAWASALARTDPARALERLRALYKRFDRRSAHAAHLWLPFQESVLDARFTELLTDDDFEQLGTVGQQLAIAAGGGLTEAWSPLIQAALARQTAAGQHRAYTLLTGLYWSSLTSEEVRRGSAVTLAGFEAVGEAQLSVYADVASFPTPMPEVMTLIDRVLQVGFDDGDQRLGQAYSLAAKLGGRVPRLDAVFALALGELLLHRRPHAALRYFQALRGREAFDTEALRGVIAAHMHAREFSAAVSVATAATSPNPRCIELLALCRQLAWLDAPHSLTETEASADTPPQTAEQLATIASGRDTGPWLDYAIGRSHLLDGDAEQAQRFLAPLPIAGLSDPDALYHAAWAHLLCQDVEAIRADFLALAGQPGSWALSCMLQDAEPGQAMPELAPLVPSTFRAVAQARETLAEQGAASAPVDLIPLTLHDATRPDLFEALRTALGVAVARDDVPTLDSLIRQPLFARLPAAERLLWTGLAERPLDPERARQTLRRALVLGRNRAALILAVDALDDGRPAEARELLHGVTGPKADLILAWIEARAGEFPQATERFVTLAELGSAHADYALGLLALRAAARSWARETPGQAASRAEQAVKALTIASQRAPERFDTTSLTSAATLLLATPDADNALPWQKFTAQPWIARQLGFGQVVLAPEAADSSLLHAISDWALQSSPELAAGSSAGSIREPGPVATECPPEYAALAEAVLRVALLTTDTAICEQAAMLLAGLAEHVPAPEIQTAARRATAFAALRTGDETTAEASSDPLIALAATSAMLGEGRKAPGPATEERTEAVRILRVAAPEQSSDPQADQHTDPWPEYRALVALLADALGHGRLPQQLPIDLPARAESALALAAAMGAYGDEEAAAEMLLRALRTADVNDLVDLDRALAALCTQVAKQHGDRRNASAAALAPIVLRAAESAGEPGGLGNHPVARYATVVGEYETADRLWQRALVEANADWIRIPQLHVEYGRFLCHRAVLAHLDGRREHLFGYLRAAAAYVPEPAERILRQLEADERVQKLVGSLFPGSPVLSWQRPGRYQSLDGLIASNPDLRAVLDADKHEQIAEQWRLAVAGSGDGGDRDGNGYSNVELWHTIAVLSREDALARPPGAAAAAQAGTSAMALWMLLLAEPALRRLFRDRPHAAEAEVLLRTQLIDELLVSQKVLLTQALAQHDLHAVRAHVHSLDSVRQGTVATRSLVTDTFTDIAARIGIEAEFVPIGERAMALLEEWGAERVAAGQLRLGDRTTSKRRARAVVVDYGAAIEEVAIVAQLGLGLKEVLRVGLEWHNVWLQSLHGVHDQRLGDHVVRSARRFVDVLAPMCTQGQAHLPEVRTLAEHYIALGVFNFDVAPDQSIRLLEHARVWNPAAERVPELLWDAYMRCFEVAKQHLDRGSLPDAEGILSLVPEGRRMLATELNNRSVAKLNHVYDTVMGFHRRGIDLNPAQRANFLPELLDAERLLLEAARLDPGETGIGDNLEQIRETMKMLSPGAGGTYR